MTVRSDASAGVHIAFSKQAARRESEEGTTRLNERRSKGKRERKKSMSGNVRRWRRAEGRASLTVL